MFWNADEDLALKLMAASRGLSDVKDSAVLSEEKRWGEKNGDINSQSCFSLGRILLIM